MAQTVEAAMDAIGRLQSEIRAGKLKHVGDVAFKKIATNEIQEAEKVLGVKLPPSYVHFVTKLGAFKITRKRGQTDYDRVKQFYRPLLSPSEIVSITLETRAAYEEQEADEQTAQMLKDALLFQGNLYHDNFHTFRISSKRQDGEMCIDDFLHDDNYVGPVLMKPGNTKMRTFPDHICELVTAELTEAEED